MDCVPQLTVPPVAVASGGMISPVTAVDAVLVQPFAPRTTTLYVPALLTLAIWFAEVKLLGPVQAKVLPAAVGPPLRKMVGVVQLITPPVDAEAPGGVLSSTTKAVFVAVQLLTVLVTVTV